MLLAWMVSSVLFASLLGLAASASERVARLLTRQGRYVWIAALSISVLWPIGMQLLSRREVAALAPVVVTDTPAGSIRAMLRRMPSRGGASSPAFDRALMLLWSALSLLLALRHIRANQALSQLRQDANCVDVDGVEVLLTPGFGPATIGIRRPQIALPSWILEFEPGLRTLVVQHERQHQRAHDTSLILLAEIAVVLMPWNPALWWQTRRLRLALELDCDQRLLRENPAGPAYARLLLLVAQRAHRSTHRPLIAAFDSHLHQRISAMLASRVTHIPLRIAALSIVAAAALISACAPEVQSDMAKAPTQASVAKTTESVLTEAEVASPVQADLTPSSAPKYPAELLSSGKEGEVLVSYVVDTTGLVLPETFTVLRASDQRFADAVRSALPSFRYTPATAADGRKVRQVVQAPFAFALNRSPLPPR